MAYQFKTASLRERESRGTPEDEVCTGGLGVWAAEWEENHAMPLLGVSVKKDYHGWLLTVRSWLQGEFLVAFRHIARWSEMGEVVKEVMEGDDWKHDRFATAANAERIQPAGS